MADTGYTLAATGPHDGGAFMSVVPGEPSSDARVRRPAPGVPYTVFLGRAWYGPDDQRALAALGFQFAPPNAYGNAQPVLDRISLDDMPLSALLGLLASLNITMTLSVCHAEYWEGEWLEDADTFWYCRLHYDD